MDVWMSVTLFTGEHMNSMFGLVSEELNTTTEPGKKRVSRERDCTTGK